MQTYIIIEKWLAYFFIYCFIGWCFESTYVTVCEKQLTNRGFLKGPILPIYGFGALTILLSTAWVSYSIPLIFLCGMVGATVLEYVTGVVMEAMFSMRYWTYEHKKFNYKGYICLESSIVWGVFSVLMVKVIHVPIKNFVESCNMKILGIIVLAVCIVEAVDLVISFKQAISFQKILAYETAIKKEISEIANRLLEAKSAFTEFANEKQKEYFSKQEDRLKSLEDELESVKIKSAKNYIYMIRSFPHATSEKFGDALDEVKKRVKLRKKDI